MAIGKDLVRVGVTLFAGTGTSRTLLQLDSQYETFSIGSSIPDPIPTVTILTPAFLQVAAASLTGLEP
jgi:hypothetical protein